MLAMDVVDTLRHREQILLRELDKDGREAELIDRLKEIYAAQGIEVPEAILRDGVRALEENRFTYTPPRDSLSVKLAKLYVARDAWLKPVAGGLVGLAALFGVWQVGVAGPRASLVNSMPQELAQLRTTAQEMAEEDQADILAETYYQDGLAALEDGQLSQAKAARTNLETLMDDLEKRYEIRVVYGPDEPNSGIIRIPNDVETARNYYLIVEAIDPAGRRVEVPVRSEEDRSTKRTKKWALRVSESAFERVFRDKSDDQIIQNNVVARKESGYLTPDYLIDSSGGAILEWEAWPR